MERVQASENFLRKIAGASKKEAAILLQSASETEFKSLVEVLVNVDTCLDKNDIKKCKSGSLCKKLKRLKKITKKSMLKLFKKSFKQLASLIGFMIIRLFEEGVLRVYCGQNGELL